jgi:alpha-2-macroglobulin
MGFSTERADGLWWLMVSPDVNAVRTLLAVVDLDAWKEDAPRIAKGAVGRMRQGHWDTTTANAWGTLAFDKFSAAFEKEEVSGKTAVSLGPKISTVGWGFWETPQGGTLRFDWPDRKETLGIRHDGAGAPWATVQGLAAVPLRKPFSSGYRIKKTVTPVEKKVKNFLSRGDVLRVTLEIEAQSDMTWVVLSDPIPAGSAILTVGFEPGSDKNAGRVQEAYTERAFEACRFYYSYVPKGTWKTGYTLRLNNEGTFQMPPTRAEALYAPEMFGEIPNAAISVNP